MILVFALDASGRSNVPIKAVDHAVEERPFEGRVPGVQFRGPLGPVVDLPQGLKPHIGEDLIAALKRRSSTLALHLVSIWNSSNQVVIFITDKIFRLIAKSPHGF